MPVMKKWIVKLFVTPERVRRGIASCVAWFMSWACETEAWDVVSALPKWLRRLADMIEVWNDTELSPQKDRLVTEIVRDAVTDEQVGDLIERISALQATPDAAFRKASLGESISNCLSALLGFLTKRTDRNDLEVDRIRERISTVEKQLSDAVSDGRITDVAALNKELVRLRHDLSRRGGSE